MADTTFTPGTTITSAWLNDVNDTVYTTIPDIQTKLNTFVRATDYTSLQEAYNSLAATGGVVFVPAGYSETLTANLVLNKPFSGFIFMGNATILMGSYRIVMNDSCPGQFIDTISGVSGGDYWAQVQQGVFFKYTNAATNTIAIELGQGTLQTGSTQDCFRLLRGFALNIELAGSGTVGIQLNNQLRANIEGVNVKASGAGSSGMIGLQLKAVGTGYVGWVNIKDSFFSGGMVGVDTVGQVNLCTWKGGGCSTSLASGTTWGIRRGSAGAAFIATEIEIAGATRAVQTGSGCAGDHYENYGESNTYDVYFDVGASHNFYKNIADSNPPLVSDANGAASTNIAVCAGDLGSTNLKLAGNGSALYGTTSAGNSRKLISTGASSTSYYGDIVADILVHQFMGASGTLAYLNAAGMTIAGGIGVNGASAQARVTGFGTPTGSSVINNFPGATATLGQTSATVSKILEILKATGLIGA